MANIKKVTLKNGETRYELSVYLGVDPHTRKKKKTKRRFKTLKEAKLAHAQLKLEVHSKGVNSINNYTFKDVYELWMANHQNEVRGTTLANKKSKFKARILPKFGHIKIKDIKPFYCQKVVNEWAKELKTIQDYTIQANLVFKFAIKMEFIEKNPMEFVVIPRNKEENYYTEPFKNFLTKEELKQFMKILEEEGNTQYTCLFRVLAFCGLRKGEALALHWSDIDWDNKTININKTTAWVNKKMILQPPKTKDSIRIISVDSKTLKLFKRWKNEQVDFYKQFGFEVTNDKNQPIFSRYVHKRNTMDYMREATPNDILTHFYERHPGLKEITIHGFRHTHASLLFESGANPKDVQARLGHSDIQTTMNIYTHVTNSSRERVATLFNDFMDEN